jgi:hypothetical protein
LVRAELSSINKKEELELIIDTGAEKTCLSDDHIRDLELVQAGEPKKVKGAFDKSSSPRNLYWLKITIDNKEVTIRCFAGACDSVVGMDVLERFLLTMRGTEEVTLEALQNSI